LGNIFSKEDLVRFAMFGEKVASGVKHADNIAPCIYGGITLIRSIFPLDIVPISFPPLFVTVVHPQIEVRTSDARQILRKEVLLKDAIRQWGNIGGLVAGFMKNDFGDWKIDGGCNHWPCGMLIQVSTSPKKCKGGGHWEVASPGWAIYFHVDKDLET
jgi:homoserine kinase